MQLLLILVALLLPLGLEQPFQSHQAVNSVSSVITAEYFLPAEIIGGREARPHSHPYMAYLLIRTPGARSVCGGFLVREDFVMTAGHCLGSSITAILGAHNISRRERTQQRISVRRAIRHPGYSQQNLQNDIMLLQLENRARQNRFVRPLALPQSRVRLRPGSRCTVAGWGLVSLNRNTDTLRDVELRVQRDRTCLNRFRAYNSQRQICVGDPRRRRNAFKGDSGGPLVCNNVAQGIVSFGSNVGDPPAVFTRVSSFLPWINTIMRRFKQEGIKRNTPQPSCD